MKKLICMLLLSLILLASCNGESAPVSTGETDPFESDPFESETILTEEGTEEEQETAAVTMEEPATVVPPAVSSSSTSASTKKTTTTKKKDNTDTGLDPGKLPQAPTGKEIYYNSDLNREQRADFGTAVDGGYVYYTNSYSTDHSGLFRKKLEGGEEEQVLPSSPRDYKVLNGKIYYIQSGNVYCCNANGSEITLLDGAGAYSRLDVAGNWVFGVRTGANYVEELFAMRTDGSGKQQIKAPGEPTTKAEVTLLGFNRGFAYFDIAHFFGPYNEYLVRYIRVDYRTPSLTVEDVECNADVKYDGKNIYSFKSSTYNSVETIYYDHFVMTDLGNEISISLTENVAHVITSTRSLVRLKDYCVYTDFARFSHLDVCFVDHKGGVKKVSVPNSSGEMVETVDVSTVQGIHDNIFLLRVTTRNTRSLFAVKADGTAIEIYKRQS